MQFIKFDILNIYKSTKSIRTRRTMALLLAMYQKMRLIREKNQATLDLTKFSSKYDHVSKSIERVQKRYTSLFANLEAQAKQMQSNAKVMFQNMAGLGATQVNPYDYTGMTQYVANYMRNACISGIKEQTDSEGNVTQNAVNMDDATFQKMYQEYMQNGKILQKIDSETGKPVYTDNDTNKPEYENDYEPDQVKLFMYAMQTAKQAQSNAQWQVQQMSTNYDNNVSVWLDAAKAQLEAEQDAALEPLNYQQTMWELEKEQAEQKLTRIKAELESYTQLCNEEAKEQAPKFGLG